MDGFEVQRVAEHEGDVASCAEIAQPIPVEGAFASHDDAGVGFELLEEAIGLSRFEVSMEEFVSALVDDASVHLIGVQIDSAVEWMLSLIQVHWFSLVGLMLSQQLTHSRVTSFARCTNSVTNFTARL